MGEYKNAEKFERGLSAEFINDLKEGKLKVLLETVKSDNNLCLSIRNEYINIYYRGGNICKVTKKNEKYLYEFDDSYIKNTQNKEKIMNTYLKGDIQKIIEIFPLVKSEMDCFFGEKEKAERECQQLIVRENNYSNISNDTDYFIADIEYANKENGSRFDMVAVKWPSTGKDRRNPINTRLSFIEVKFGDDAIDGKAGIQKHAKDILSFCKMNTNIYNEVEKLLNQEIELGIANVSQKKKEVKLTREKPEFIFLFANHKPAKTKLKTELKKIVEMPEYEELKNLCDLKIAKSSCMGYGLYEDTIVSLEDFINE